MKKRIIAALLIAALAVSAAACGNETKPADNGETSTTSEKSEGVMTYAEYMAAEIGADVTVETYVQDKQSWWDNKARFYTQDEDGAYFLYDMPCTEEEYGKLVPGTKIRVTGKKAMWPEGNGEIEISDITSFEILDGSFIAEATDVTALLGTDELKDHMNQRVTFKGMTVEAYMQDEDGNDLAFAYNDDNSGEPGSDADLYFKVSKDGNEYVFTVEYYLRNEETDVYKAVQALEIGSTVDLEGYLYWYTSANPHIISVTAAE